MLRNAGADASKEDARPLEPALALPLLAQLKSRPLAARFPFFGVLGPALDHENELIAAAALAVLSGATGPYAWSRITRALSDPRPRVQIAAVTALHASSQTHPLRFVHALFHPDPRVREAAQTLGPPPACDAQFSIYLLADPHSRGAVLARMAASNQIKSFEHPIDFPIPTAAQHLPALFDLIQNGDLPAPLARRLLSGVPWDKATSWMAKARQRNPSQIDHIVQYIDCIDAAHPPSGAPAGNSLDDFDTLFDLMWQDPGAPANPIENKNNSAVDVFWSQFSPIALLLKPALRRRVMASILWTALQKQYFCEPAEALCTALMPHFSAARWLDPGTRHPAVPAAAPPDHKDKTLHAWTAEHLPAARGPSSEDHLPHQYDEMDAASASSIPSGSASCAAEHLLQLDGPFDTIASGLRAFLQSGSEQPPDLRLRAAEKLRAHGDFMGLPLLLEHIRDKNDEIVKQLLTGAPAAEVRAAVRAVLTAGKACAPEMIAVRLLECDRIDEQTRMDACAELFVAATSDLVRNAIVGKLERGPARSQKLRRLARAFAWGIRAGRTLTGRPFSVRMASGGAMGYTRLDADHLFVSPLPILRNVPHAHDIVTGLILHELGHHLYHRGDEARAVWEKAQKESLFTLLNLVADEHLERNLRSQSDDYGHRLKRCAAHAFQHAEKDIPVQDLLAALGGHAFSILSNVRLHPARNEGSVRVSSGPLLSAMERAGRSFPRFVRALRMGLGSRSGDPQVERALSLFRGDLKARSMHELYQIAEQLRDVFGWQTQMLDQFGSAETLGGSPSELSIAGEGIRADEVEAEMGRLLEPEENWLRQSDENGRRAGLPIHVAPGEAFTPILSVVSVPFNPIEYKNYAGQVARHARIMRAYLEELGLQNSVARRRTSGSRFDRARAKDALLTRDPRILRARRDVPGSDLFIGVLIDCSSSMRLNGHIEKAKLFSVMLAEAVRGMPGVELSLTGFSADTLFDAGNADRCCVAGLVAHGGNNDAAALWHGALRARKSLRKCRLLVMISDGLPTECSAAALRALAHRLASQAHIVCAQIAVQPLADVCFPHYVELGESHPDAAVRRFGEIVAGLARKTIRLNG